MSAAARVITEMTLRELGRRRTVLILLVLLPLSFYLARRDLPGQSLRMLELGLGWAVSTLALFSTVAARDLDQRLRVAGARVRDIALGRLVAVVAIGLVLGVSYAVLVALDQDFHPYDGVLVGLGVVVVVGAPLGMALGAILPKELEGALALMVVLAVQMLADPAELLAKVLPFWAVPEIGYYTVDGAGQDYLWRGVAHAGVSVAVLCTVAAVAAAARLRLVKLPEP